MKDNIIGRFAVSRAGHDKDTVYMILAEEDRYLYLADGKFHTPDKPKKKNRKHVQLMNEETAKGITERLRKKEKLFDHEIKYAIKQVLRKEEKHV